MEYPSSSIDIPPEAVHRWLELTERRAAARAGRCACGCRCNARRADVPIPAPVTVSSDPWSRSAG